MLFKTKTQKNICLLGVTITLMFFVLLKAGINNVYETFLDANPFYLILALCLSLSTVFFKAMRWKLILRKLDQNVSFRSATNYFCVGVYGSVLTPAKVGDILRAHSLKKRESIPYIDGVASVVFDRVTDLLAIFSLMFFGFFFVFLSYDDSSSLIKPFLSAFLLVSAIILGLHLASKERFGGKFMKKISNKMVKSFKSIEQHVEKDSSAIVDDFYLKLKSLTSDKSFFAFSILFAMGIWSISLSQAYFVLVAFNVHVGVQYVFACVTLAVVIGLIPITLSGLGTRDATIIFLFGIIGVSSAAAGAMSLTIYFFGLVIPALYGGLYFFKTNLR